MSYEYKLDILRFHNQSIDDEIGQVLYKHKDRKRQLEARLGTTLDENTELLSIINIEEETFKIEDYV